jgi:hypothetical protein
MCMSLIAPSCMWNSNIMGLVGGSSPIATFNECITFIKVLEVGMGHFTFCFAPL